LGVSLKAYRKGRVLNLSIQEEDKLDELREKEKKDFPFEFLVVVQSLSQEASNYGTPTKELHLVYKSKFDDFEEIRDAVLDDLYHWQRIKKVERIGVWKDIK
jgi:hypothetical protein